ncbi:MAG: serine/threonine-protein kinase [Myxococcota bacterium]
MEGVSAEVEARIGTSVVAEDGRTWGLEAVLGEGGFGAVYRASGPEGAAAVKVLHPHLAAHEETVVRFQREALAAATIGSEHIVRVDASGITEGMPWIAMELLEGRDLRAVLEEEGPLVLGRACRIGMSICDGLTSAHAEDIVHRDLKLDNVFLLGDGSDDRIKLVDFGVSKFLANVDGESLMTRTGTALGTPYYMSPEQAQGDKGVDARTDLYSLGVVLFKLLTDQHPFADPSYPMLVMKICTEPPPSVSEYRADVPPAFDAVLWRLLAKAKEGRFKNAKKVKEALAAFADAADPPQLNTQAQPTEEKPAIALAVTVASQAPGEPATVDGHTGEPVRPDLAEEAEALEETLEGRDRGKLKPALAILTGLLLLGAALVGLSRLGGEEPPPPPPPEPPPRRVALPRPQPAVPVPLRTREPNALGWRWMNPVPKALPTWNGVDAASGGSVVMVGRRGGAARYVGGSLVGWASGTEKDLHGVAWIGPAQAIAVGDGGTIRALLLGGARAIESGTEVGLRAVVPVGTLDAFVVGDRGTLIKLTNLVAVPWETGREESLFDALLLDETLYAVGQRGVVLAIDTETRRVRVEREGGANLRAVGGCPGGDLYAVGDGGTVFRRQDGRWQRAPLESREDLHGVACDRGRAVVAGGDGHAFLFTGDRSVRLESGSERGFLAASGDGSGDGAWIVGEGGLLARVASDRILLSTVGHTGALFGAASLAGIPFAVGRWGAVLRYRNDRFEERPSPTDSGLAALAPLGDGRLLAVGDSGALLAIRYDDAELLEPPPGPITSWKDVVAAEGLVLAVGDGGATLRGAPEALVRGRVDGAGALRALAGTPSRAVAVGAEGLVVRFGLGDAALPERCGGADLNDVSWSGSGPAWAVGAGGVIVRLEVEGALQCTEERAGDGTPLHAVGPGWDRERLLGVGDDGLALTRRDDGRWEPVDLDAAGFDLYGIHRDERDVYVVGAGGVIVRHARVP